MPTEYINSNSPLALKQQLFFLLFKEKSNTSVQDLKLPCLAPFVPLVTKLLFSASRITEPRVGGDDPQALVYVIITKRPVMSLCLVLELMLKGQMLQMR